MFQFLITKVQLFFGLTAMKLCQQYDHKSGSSVPVEIFSSKGATALHYSNRVWRLLTAPDADFADSGPSDLLRTCGSRQRRAQQLIKPGLMALNLAHNPEEHSWRKRGVIVHAILEQEELREMWDAWRCSITVSTIKQNSVRRDFLSSTLKMCLSLRLKRWPSLKASQSVTPAHGQRQLQFYLFLKAFCLKSRWQKSLGQI